MTSKISNSPETSSHLLEKILASSELSRDFVYVALLEEVLRANSHDIGKFVRYRIILGSLKFSETFQTCFNSGFFGTNIVEIIAKTTPLEKWATGNESMGIIDLLDLFLYALESVTPHHDTTIAESPHWNIKEEYARKKEEFLGKLSYKTEEENEAFVKKGIVKQRGGSILKTL